jgi:hypothetical protein
MAMTTLIRALWGTLLLTIVALAAASSAQAAAVRQIEIHALRAPDGSRLALEAQSNGDVLLRPSKPSLFRQRWVQESSPFGGVTFRNQGTLACLRDHSPVTDGGRNLRAGSCNDLIGGRQRWKFASGSIGNTGQQLINQGTGLLPLVFTDDFNQFDVTTALKSFAEKFPNNSEWRMPLVGTTS